MSRRMLRHTTDDTAAKKPLKQEDVGRLGMLDTITLPFYDGHDIYDHWYSMVRAWAGIMDFLNSWFVAHTFMCFLYPICK